MEKKNFDFELAQKREAEFKQTLENLATQFEAVEARECNTDDEKDKMARELSDLKYRQAKAEAGLARIQSQISANTEVIEVKSREEFPSADAKIRECIDNNKRFELRIARSAAGANTTGGWSNGTDGAPVKITTGDILQPLEEGLILSKIGTPLIQNAEGDLYWPIVEGVDATLEGEGVALGDTTINVNKLKADPKRAGIAVPVTKQAIYKSSGLVETIVRQRMPQALARLLNKIMFSPAAVSNSSNGNTISMSGAFVNASTKVTVTGQVPTYADVLGIKAAVLGQGIIPDGTQCYVMSENMRAQLRATPKWSGASTPVIDDNGTIDGVPVFCSHYINNNVSAEDLAKGKENIGFGVFHYCPVAIFGELSFIVDPYTLSRNGKVDFVLNTDVAMTTLRNEAFGLITTTKKA